MSFETSEIERLGGVMHEWMSHNAGLAAGIAAILCLGGLAISSLWDKSVRGSTTGKSIGTIVTIVVTLAIAVGVLYFFGHVDPLGLVSDQAKTTGGEDTKEHGFPWLRIIFALAWLIIFGRLTKSTFEPKEWSVEKNEDGEIINPARVRWSSVLSCISFGLFGSLTILGVHLGQFWWLFAIALVADSLYVVPFLHTYVIFMFQHQVAFWQKGLRIGLPGWVRPAVWQIWNLSRAKIEATFNTKQLPTGDTPLMIKSAVKAGVADGQTSEDETLSSTISLENWVLFWTNWWPWKFIRYSRTDREQIKTIVFNIIAAMETELLLDMPFMTARQLQRYFITNVDLQHEADSAGYGAEFKALEERNAEESYYLDLANKVFKNDRARVSLYERFLELRKRVLVLIGCYIEEIRVTDRNAPPEIEAAINGVTLARLNLQNALINVQILAAEGDAISARDANALKGVLALLRDNDNASLLLAWTEFKRATENKNISIGTIGGVDLAKILGGLVQKTS